MVPIAKAVGPRLGYPHKATVIRWILKGVRTPDGRRVKLRAWRFGSRWMTNTESVEEFIRATTAPADPDQPPRSPSGRRQASEQARAELKAMGM
jgi:hypothetical protein